MGTDIEVEEFQDKLSMLAIKIAEQNFEDKPEYFKIPTHNLLDQKDITILEKLSNITKYCIVSPIEILYKHKYEFKKKISTEKDKCSICQFELYEDELAEYEKNPENFLFLRDIPFNVILLEKCADHFFHIECIGNLIENKNSFKCPNCAQIYGVLMGDMPNGTFNAYKSQSHKCSGFNCDTIIIQYNIPSGYGFSGTSRISYLPNNKEGREVLALLKVAFDRRLTFTVGTSVTTGRKNTVVWNGIHHKTNLVGGPSNFGYPDNTYFNRVKQELASKGVTQESIGRDLESIAKEILKE